MAFNVSGAMAEGQSQCISFFMCLFTSNAECLIRIFLWHTFALNPAGESQVEVKNKLDPRRPSLCYDCMRYSPSFDSIALHIRA